MTSADKSNKFGVAIIGASMRSTMMFDYLKRHPEQGCVTGIYDLVSSRSRYLIDKYGPGEMVIYKSLAQAVDDPRVQAVFVGTPDCEHVVSVVAALQAGKHVYLEKPMATIPAFKTAMNSSTRPAAG